VGKNKLQGDPEVDVEDFNTKFVQSNVPQVIYDSCLSLTHSCNCVSIFSFVCVSEREVLRFCLKTKSNAIGP